MLTDLQPAAPDFWASLDQWVAECRLTIDRPRGSTHPRYPQMRYPLDYGSLSGTRGGDGAELDVWLGSLPARTVTAVICALDLRKRDAELKVLLGCTPDEARMLAAFHNDGLQAAILVERV